uniref:Hemocyte protein-glutamine gamma-glutamyltransferase-like protein n=1 Tax=Triatoma infestans TaxID=30076 RepID=A0A161N4H4_TRIIF
MINTFDANGELGIHESLWNFHAWIDVWLARPDLPPGYGGWQAVDPTMNIGPSSLEAIKRGEVGYEFDVTEKISEVNADLVDWKEDEKLCLATEKLKPLQIMLDIRC